MTMLNNTFERELALADEGYESGSETSNLPTPLRWTSRIYHVSSNEHITFDPSTLHTLATSQSNCKPVCHCLSFDSSDDEENSTSLPLFSMGIAKSPTKFISTTCADSEEEEEDFQTVALDDDHWLWILFLTDICASMNIHNHILCVVTHVSIWILLQYCTRTHWISVIFLISKMWWSPTVMWISLL